MVTRNLVAPVRATVVSGSRPWLNDRNSTASQNGPISESAQYRCGWRVDDSSGFSEYQAGMVRQRA